jgi:hypothetical protein
VRTLAEDSLIAMAEHQAFGLQPCLNMLYRSTNPPQDGKKDKKTMQSNKHIQGRYQALLRILSQFEVKEPSLVKGAVGFALKGIQHNLQDVRNVAYKCMSELYRLVGPNIRQQIGELRPAQMEALEAAFAEVDGGIGGGAPAMKQAPKETIMTNIDPHAGKKGPAAAKKKAPHQISKYDEEDEDSE